jgi:8-oxo-dGTP diphosphatase
MDDESTFLAGYDPSAYPAVAVTVDVVALTIRAGVLHVLLVERGEAPFRGRQALPGGFVKAGPGNAETLDEAARRELAEETGLRPGQGALDRVHLEQLRSYGDPGRDPRMRVVSVAYLAFAPELPDPQAGGDASGAAWVPLAAPAHPDRAGSDRAGSDRSGSDRSGGASNGAGGGTNGNGAGAADGRALAFDHGRILADGIERARSKLEYTPLATAFVGAEFTIAELRAVYAAVWGEDLHAGNFHRKVLSVPGFVESVGATTSQGSQRGGPRSKLYRAGDARVLHPPLLRPTREDGVR